MELTMQPLLEQLMTVACREQVVRTQALLDGAELLAYPLAHGALVGIGFARGASQGARISEVLRRRAARMAELGDWLPVMLGDGSWYLARRLRDNADGPSARPAAAELAAVRELLR